MTNNAFSNAIAMQPQAVPPIWMMRQAGRYHHHYQALRQKYSFTELCKLPEVAAEVAMGPIRDFDFDVAILFSDLLFPLEALGMGLHYGDSGPKLDWHLDDTTVKDLRSVDEALPEMQFQKLAMQCTREVLPNDKSLIGFVGGPWTLFVYATAGSHKGNLAPALINLHHYQAFCEKMVPLLQQNIQLQFDGGAEVVMLFDTAAGELPPALYHQLVVPQLEQLAAAYPGKLGYYAKAIQPAHYSHPLFAQGLLAGLGYDHRWPAEEMFSSERSGFKQGNFYELLLCQDETSFQKHLHQHIARMKTIEDRRGWVCGLGHGVVPQAKESNVRYLVDTIREQFSHG